MYISFSDSLKEMKHAERVVLENRRNYTEPPVSDFYLTIIPVTGSERGEHQVDIDLRYYEYDPKCP